MSLVPSLLQAIVRVDGEALVMHAGDKPYVVSPTGQVELASKGLALEAVNGIVSQLLPVELQQALDEFGAVQYELPAAAEFPGEQFTVVAARGGDDVWIEIRRRHIDENDRVPEELLPPRPSAAVEVDATIPAAMMPERVTPPAAAIAPPPEVVIAPPPVAVVAPPPPVVAPPPAPAIVQPPAMSARAEAISEELGDDDLLLPEADQLWGSADVQTHRAVESEFELDLDEPAEPPPAPAPVPPVRIETPPVLAAPPPAAPAMVAIEPPTVVLPPLMAVFEPPPVVPPPLMAVFEPPPVVVPPPMAVFEPPPVDAPPPMAVFEPPPVVIPPPIAVS